MIVLLKQLILNNFKGARNVIASFTSKNTSIFGPNASGKSTIYDAFLWLLFDKDSSGRKDFEIKTLDTQGKTIKDLEHSVEGYFDVDGTEISLKKVHKENWVRKKGSKTEEYIGNTTTYFWNNVPLKKEEYNYKLKDIFGDEDTFRLLSDIKYFNTLNWQQRRQLLFGLINEKDFDTDDPELRQKLKGKTPDELKREINASKKKLLDKIDQCPIRIDEVNKTLRIEMETESTALIDGELLSIDEQLSSQKKSSEEFNKKVINAQKEKSRLLNLIEGKKLNIKNSFRDKIKDKDDELYQLKIKEFPMNTFAIDQLKKKIKHINEEMNDLRDAYGKKSDEVFSDNLSCPTCGKEFDETKKTELIKKFNENKSKKLESINEQGIALKETKDKWEKELNTLYTLDEASALQKEENDLLILNLTKEIEEAKPKYNEQYFDQIATDDDILTWSEEIKAIDESLNEQIDEVDNTKLIDQRKNLLLRKQTIQQAIDNNKLREEQLQRIRDLEQERLTLLDDLSALERLEFVLGEYIKQKIEHIEKYLKDLFNGVEFKMFEFQVNGGIAETCIVQHKGVPYSDLNTASRVWVSLNIITSFSKIKNLYVPIFIDNRESVTKLPEVQQQTVSLIVSAEHKSLTIK